MGYQLICIVSHAVIFMITSCASRNFDVIITPAIRCYCYRKRCARRRHSSKTGINSVQDWQQLLIHTFIDSSFNVVKATWGQRSKPILSFLTKPLRWKLLVKDTCSDCGNLHVFWQSSTHQNNLLVLHFLCILILAILLFCWLCFNGKIHNIQEVFQWTVGWYYRWIISVE